MSNSQRNAIIYCSLDYIPNEAEVEQVGRSGLDMFLLMSALRLRGKTGAFLYEDEIAELPPAKESPQTYLAETHKYVDVPSTMLQ